jgi:hypothetical protein
MRISACWRKRCGAGGQDGDISLLRDAVSDSLAQGLTTRFRLARAVALGKPHGDTQGARNPAARGQGGRSMTSRTYASPAAMRTALEQRLRDRHRTSKLPLDRLRKEVALQRLLARICAAAPAGSWALKGGVAMIARLGERARTTADADATWRADREQLRDMLDHASAQDLGDHFEFTIGQGRRIEGEGPDNGLRFPVTARLASRIFEQTRLDVNIMTEVADISSVTVPAIKLDQQLAEKLHAYTRDYGRQENGRAKDPAQGSTPAQVVADTLEQPREQRCDDLEEDADITKDDSLRRSRSRSAPSR